MMASLQINLRCTLILFYFELALQTVHDDSRWSSPIPGDNGLTGLFVGVYAERRIFFGKFGKRHTQLVNVGRVSARWRDR